MKHLHSPSLAPFRHLFRPVDLRKTVHEAESGSHQHQTRYLGVPRGVERCEITPHAGTDEAHRLVDSGALDHGKLPGNREMLEVVVREVGDRDFNARPFQAFAKKPRFAGRRPRGEAVKVDEVHWQVLNQYNSFDSIKMQRFYLFCNKDLHRVRTSAMLTNATELKIF